MRMSFKGVLALSRFDVPDLRSSIPGATHEFVCRALRQAVNGTFVACKLHSWIAFNIDQDYAMVLACREKARTIDGWDYIHDKTFVMDQFLQVIVFSRLSIQCVHLVRVVNGARHDHICTLLEG